VESLRTPFSFLLPSTTTNEERTSTRAAAVQDGIGESFSPILPPIGCYGVTVSVVVLVTPPNFALTVVLPLANAVASPLELIGGTPGF